METKHHPFRLLIALINALLIATQTPVEACTRGPAEALKLVTHDNSQLLALSGPRNHYPGKLGVVAEGALADLLLMDGDPIVNLKLIEDPAKNFVVNMKDGKIYKKLIK